MSEERAGRPTAPRGWRPGPVYILAALVAIALILVWLFSRGPEPTLVPVGAPEVPAPNAGR